MSNPQYPIPVPKVREEDEGPTTKGDQKYNTHGHSAGTILESHRGQQNDRTKQNAGSSLRDLYVWAEEG